MKALPECRAEADDAVVFWIPCFVGSFQGFMGFFKGLMGSFKGFMGSFKGFMGL